MTCLILDLKNDAVRVVFFFACPGNISDFLEFFGNTVVFPRFHGLHYQPPHGILTLQETHGKGNTVGVKRSQNEVAWRRPCICTSTLCRDVHGVAKKDMSVA